MAGPREPMRLTITDAHLNLLARMCVGWCGDEFGAPEIDPKRPYGNSDVYGDLAEILNSNPADDRHRKYSAAERTDMRTLHEEMRHVLQILVRHAGSGIRAGQVYERKESWDRRWELVSAG